MSVTFVSMLQDIGRGIRPWVTVKPWEQGVRVRGGKYVRLLHAGMYPKIPIIDTATVYPIRRRSTIPLLQTVKSFDKRTLTIGIVVVYRIADLLKVLDTLHNPENMLAALARGAVAEFVAETRADDVTQAAIRGYVHSQIDAASFGLEDFEVLVIDNADLSGRTLRILNDGHWNHGDTIDEIGRDA